MSQYFKESRNKYCIICIINVKMKAGVHFVHEKLKNYFIPIEEILSNRNDTDHPWRGKSHD